jgi:hypothetical protein
MHAFSQALQPGRFLVDIFPWLRFVPEWFPGTGWKKIAKEWRHLRERMENAGYDWSLEQIVRILDGADLTLTPLVLSETRQGYPGLLHFRALPTAGP